MVWNGFMWVIERLCLWTCQNVSKRSNTKDLIVAAGIDPVDITSKDKKLQPMDCCDRRDMCDNTQ
jgi:hypothetical protein